MDRLAVSPDAFRTLASRAVELMTRYLECRDEMPSFPSISGTQACASFDLPLPE